MATYIEGSRATYTEISMATYIDGSRLHILRFQWLNILRAPGLHILRATVIKSPAHLLSPAHAPKEVDRIVGGLKRMTKCNTQLTSLSNQGRQTSTFG